MQPMEVIESGTSASGTSDLKPYTGCKRVEVSRGVSFAFFMIGFVACIVAFGTPYWYTDGDISYGLWTTCKRDFFSQDIACSRIIVGRPSPLSFKMRALQAHMTLGVIANGISFILYIVWFCKRSRKGSLAFSTIGLHAFAGIAQVTAVALYGDWYSSDHSLYGWSFILACVSGGIQSLTGLITLFVMPFVR